MKTNYTLFTALLLISHSALNAEEVMSAEDIAFALTPKRSLTKLDPLARQKDFSEKAYKKLNPELGIATCGIKIVATGGSQQATVAVNPSATLSFDNICFKIDSVELADEASSRQLIAIAEALKEIGDGKSFVIEGHTCDLGADAHNQDLSEKRSLAVGMFFRKQGVKCELVPFGFGENDPQYANSSEAKRQSNRRVVIRRKA